MKNITRYVFAIFLLIFCAGCMQNSRQLPSLEETYRHTDMQPFGSFIAFKGFKSEFADYWINITDEPFNETWRSLKKDSANSYSLYFLITKNLIINEEEAKAMVEYVKAGNDLFISADFIDHKLLDAFNCSVNRRSEIIRELNGRMANTFISMFYGKDITAEQYSYFYYPFFNYFNSYDTAMTRVLGDNESGLPNYILLFLGKGRLYLHAAPRAFSNYFLLTDDNYNYFESVTAYLRFNPQYVYWDEYYNSFSSTANKNSFEDNKHFSTLKVIMQNRSLKWAFYLGLGAIVLFTIFNIKRKQKEIPIIKPVKNATVDFAETIGRLYLQQKNNRNVAEKIITYFYEYLRKKYFVQTDNVNQQFINSLARKSGIGQKETAELFECIDKIQKEQEVTDEDLLLLNQKVENFKKQKEWKRI